MKHSREEHSGALEQYVIQLINLPTELQNFILNDAGICHVPLQEKQYYHNNDEREFNHLIPTTVALKTTASFDWVATSYSPTPCSRYILWSSFHSKAWDGRLTVYDYGKRKTCHQLCDVSGSRAVVVLSYPDKDNDHTICVIRGKGTRSAVENYNVLTHQQGIVTSLALHKINYGAIHRLAQTEWQSNNFLKSSFLGRMRLFNIDKNSIFQVMSAAIPCKFQELFPLNNKGSAYLGLDSEKKVVWTIHVDTDKNTIHYSKKKIAGSISHIAVNTEYATASGFYPLILLLMGDRLMGADLALKPKTVLFHLDTVPTPEKVKRLIFGNEYYGLAYNSSLTEKNHTNDNLYPLLRGTKSLGSVYFQQKMNAANKRI